jgi:hypothetical protein
MRLLLTHPTHNGRKLDDNVHFIQNPILHMHVIIEFAHLNYINIIHIYNKHTIH